MVALGGLRSGSLRRTASSANASLAGRDRCSPRWLYARWAAHEHAPEHRFSLMSMIPLLGLHGFREKFWCVNEATGMCQGVYGWQTLADAEAKAKSVALRFMTGRFSARLGLPPHPRPVPGTLLGL